MEVKRQLDVLNQRLENNTYLCGNEYTIADMAVFAWYGVLLIDDLYSASKFLSVDDYTHAVRWAKSIDARDAVQRGKRVNKTWGPEELQLKERHSAEDFKLS
jgi:GST-like protein